MDVAVTYSEQTLTVGQSTVATVTVTSSGPAEPGDMPMVDFGIPPGFDADLGDLDDQVANDHNVAQLVQPLAILGGRPVPRTQP